MKTPHGGYKAQALIFCLCDSTSLAGELTEPLTSKCAYSLFGQKYAKIIFAFIYEPEKNAVWDAKIMEIRIPRKFEMQISRQRGKKYKNWLVQSLNNYLGSYRQRKILQAISMPGCRAVERFTEINWV